MMIFEGTEEEFIKVMSKRIAVAEVYLQRIRKRTRLTDEEKENLHIGTAILPIDVTPPEEQPK